jgi:hypothetical protein
MVNDEQQVRDREPKLNETHIPITPGVPIELSAHNVSGDLTIRVTGRDDVLVRADKRGRAGSRRYAEANLEISARDNRIDIRPHLTSGGWAGFGRGLFKRGDGEKGFDIDLGSLPFGGWSDVEYDIEVELPRGEHVVEVRTASGEVEVEGVTGRLNVATASGDMELIRNTGDLTVHTASGDLEIRTAAGRLTVRTASGDLEIVDATLEQFGLTSVSGDVHLDTALTGVGPYRAESVSGDVRLGLSMAPANGGEPNATLTFQSMSGDADVEHPFRKIERRTWRVGAGDGGPRIAVKTVSGDLRVELAIRSDVPRPTIRVEEPTPPTPPEAPQPPAEPLDPIEHDAPMEHLAPMEPLPPTPFAESSEEAADAARMAVLQALERGEIDIDEALNQLDAEEPKLAE